MNSKKNGELNVASLIENLIDVLEKENSEYESLVELSRTKTPVIIKGDLKELERITDDEQAVVSQIHLLEKRRCEIVADMANVLNKDVEQIKLTNLIKMIGKSPKEQKILGELCDSLKMTAASVQQINEHNQDLIKTSLDIVEFNLNVMRAVKAAPETANYNRKACNNGYCMGSPMVGFDAKQ